MINDLQSACTRAEAVCKEIGLDILEQKEIPYGRQYKVRFSGVTSQFNIYFGKKKGLSVLSQGSANAAKEQVDNLITIMTGSAAAKSSSGKSSSSASSSKSYPQIKAAYDQPWIGTDESGKGDVFGGLVTAGVIVDPEAVPLLRSLGVDDSKKITDAKIPGMAAEIRKICYGKYKVLPLVPAKYNDLYDRFKSEGKNLNSLLAWAHASVIENLLETQQVNLVIADKFGNEALIENRLKKLGRTVQLIQVPRAEQNLAVAAASILARDAFLSWHQEAKKQHGMVFPKGASSQVVKVGRAFVKANGAEALRNVIKLHFKTTNDILS
ncbi:MAG TPA: ribonuclease HIII [Bacilli bacterium]|nr:ribonuclease HIII [Bacilli bacterium]